MEKKVLQNGTVLEVGKKYTCDNLDESDYLIATSIKQTVFYKDSFGKEYSTITDDTSNWLPYIEPPKQDTIEELREEIVTSELARHKINLLVRDNRKLWEAVNKLQERVID